MNPHTDFLSTLQALSDDDLSTAFATDPVLLKRTQKALLEAKVKQADMIKKKAAQAAVDVGYPFDLKAWTKARRILTGPFNASNAAELSAAFALSHPSITPTGEKSLLVTALEYLAERERVELDWPALVYKAGAEISYPEIKALMELYRTRPHDSLGPQSRNMLHDILQRPLDWADIEKRLIADNAISRGLVERLKSLSFQSYYVGSDTGAWASLENLARRGCIAFPQTLNPLNSHQSEFDWQLLIKRTVEDGEVAAAKVSAFEAMIDLGWCDVGLTSTTDNLNLKHSATTSLNCGSRAALAHLTMDASSVSIFMMLCEREGQKGFKRYDELGRSRLYFVNERMRLIRHDNNIATARKVLSTMAQHALELGDEPESVNAQNPLAKCADEHMSNVISAAIEKRELGAVSGQVSVQRRRATSL